MGVGAIGGFLAAALARSGADVAVVARGEHLDAIRRRGITLVASDLGPFTAKVEAAEDLRSLGEFDVVIAAFKAHQWTTLARQFEHLSGTSTQIVTLQNGVPFWYVREPALRSVDPKGHLGTLFGDDQVIGAVVHVSGHVVEAGKIHQSGGTRYLFGAPRGGTTDRIETLVSALSWAELHPEVDENIRATVWLKLVNNVGLNSTSTLHHLTTRQLLARPPVREEARVLMEEALRVGQAMGFVQEVDIEARLAYAERLGDVKTSMLQDFEAGRPLELDPILGAVIELAERVEVDVPHVRDVYARLAAHR